MATAAGGLRPWHIVVLAGLFRAALICWGEYQDRYMSVKFTDIDYVVFTDAARYVAIGQSPYRRSTYRYSPLLAYILLPNIWLHPAWGKVLFSVFDLIVAGLMSYILRRTAAPSPPLHAAALAVWLFNPYTATISTRGSCDVLSVLLLFSLLICLLYDRPLASGALYGLAVHFRIYPVIYGPAIALFLSRRSVAQWAQDQERRRRQLQREERIARDGASSSPAAQVAGGSPAHERQPDVDGRSGGPSASPVDVRDRGAPAAGDTFRSASFDSITPGRAAGTTTQARSGTNKGAGGRLSGRGAAAMAAMCSVTLFSTAAAVSFLLLGGAFCALYGKEFLNEAFLHHLTRKDPRHNFSPYYYPIYLSYGRQGAAAGAVGGASGGEGGGGMARDRMHGMATEAATAVMRRLSRWRESSSGDAGGDTGGDWRAAAEGMYGEAAAAAKAAAAMALHRISSWREFAISGGGSGGGGDVGGMEGASSSETNPEAETGTAVGPGWYGTASATLRFLTDVVPWDEPWRLAALPQAAALLAVALRFHDDLPAAWMLQTWVFVALNKVVTAQYFLWYFSLLPLVLPALMGQRRVTHGSLAAAGAFWVAAQLYWLAWAYQLECKGRSVHLPLWAAGLLFLASNTALIVLLVRALQRPWRREGRGERHRQSRGPQQPQRWRGRGLQSELDDDGDGGEVGSGNTSPDGASGGGSVNPPVMPPSFLEASLVLARRPPRAAIMAVPKQQQQQQQQRLGKAKNQ